MLPGLAILLEEELSQKINEIWRKVHGQRFQIEHVRQNYSPNAALRSN